MRAWNTSRMKACKLGKQRCFAGTPPGRWCQGSASRNAAGTGLRTTYAPRERRLFRLQLRNDSYRKSGVSIGGGMRSIVSVSIPLHLDVSRRPPGPRGRAYRGAPSTLVRR